MATEQVTTSYQPKLSLKECDKALTAPGALHEVEEVLIEGRLTKVYKNMPSSLRAFWLLFVEAHKDKELIVFENERWTFKRLHERVSLTADVLRNVYGVRKGDRVAIAMRNFPEWVVSFYAIHLLGGVIVAVNALLPLPALKFCISHTDSKVLIVDPERADVLEKWIAEEEPNSPTSSINGTLVVRHWESPKGKKGWRKMKKFDEVLAAYVKSGKPRDTWKKDPAPHDDDNCAIYFTSGTTGMPKGVLTSQRAFISALPNTLCGRMRHDLRTTGQITPADPSAPQTSALLTNPMFHVMGFHSGVMIGTAAGVRLILMRKWDKHEAVNLIKKENVTGLAGVPFTAMDLADSDNSGEIRNQIESIGVGGAPAQKTFSDDMKEKFPKAFVGQGYGLTETSSGVCSFGGPDYFARRESTGLPNPATELKIVDEATLKVQPAGQLGEIWIKGVAVMKGYWKNPEATEKVLTKDGWFRSGDVGYLDEEGYLFIKDRSKDIIIVKGENVDSATVQNAIFNDHRVLDCAAVGVPDKKVGELVTVMVSLKEGHYGKVTEEELLALAKKYLPNFARPVMALISPQPLPRNPTGKIVKKELKGFLVKEWEKRKKTGVQARL